MLAVVEFKMLYASIDKEAVLYCFAKNYIKKDCINPNRHLENT